jgi:hypothetical protein
MIIIIIIIIIIISGVALHVQAYIVFHTTYFTKLHPK